MAGTFRRLKEMNSFVREEYAFYRLCDMDFDTALNDLDILKRYNSSDIRYVLLRDVTVAYTRPFSGSKCYILKERKLNFKIIPALHRELHRDLLRLRNQLFVHTDLKYKNPRVVNWSRNGQKWFPMSFKGFDYSGLNHKTEKIFDLITSVRNNLREKMDIIENEMFKSEL
jgi:hypothetical protein